MVATTAIALAFPAVAGAALGFKSSSYPVTDFPVDIAIGDLNRDGRPDLATARSGSVLFGAGGGAFGPAQELDRGASAVTTADLNVDGWEDLVTAWGGSVDVYLGIGGGSFASPRSFGTGGQNAYSVAAGDLNRDGRPDVVTANRFSDDVSVLLGNGSGSLGLPKVLPAGDDPDTPALTGDVMITELNGDQIPDLIAANEGWNEGEFAVFLGDGTGSFGPRRFFEPSSRFASPFSIATGDLNEDGNTDLVSASYGSNNGSILFGDGAGGFEPAISIPLGEESGAIAVEDFDGDRHDDLAVLLNPGRQDVDPLLVFLGDGSGSLPAPLTFPAGHYAWTLTTGDLDVDGSPDVVVGDGSGSTVRVMLSKLSPTVGIAPSSLGFGPRPLNTTREGVLTVTNEGDGALRIADARIVGDDAGDFELAAQTCTAQRLHVGESCEIDVAFTPSVSGDRGASLRITSNGSGGPHNVPLNGVGVAPECAGRTATVVGTAGSDVLRGTSGDDVVALLAGDDTFRGGSGEDLVCGANGDDVLRGQLGRDVLRGGSGDDELRGLDAADLLVGESGDDDMHGGPGPDRCRGGLDEDDADAECETVNGVP